jgi:prevent-host-death family protein
MAAATIQASEARQRLPELLNRARYSGERFVIERHGQPVAALISFEAYRAILSALEDYEDLLEARRVLAEFRPEEATDYDAYIAGRFKEEEAD